MCVCVCVCVCAMTWCVCVCVPWLAMMLCHVLAMQIKGSSGILSKLTFSGEDTEFLLRRQQGLEVWSVWRCGLCGCGLCGGVVCKEVWLCIM